VVICLCLYHVQLFLKINFIKLLKVINYSLPKVVCMHVCNVYCEMGWGKEKRHITITVTNMVFGSECYFV
jgi:hypothetical protein